MSNGALDLRHPRLLDDIADRANRVLVSWNQDETGYDEAYGEGGGASCRMRS